MDDASQADSDTDNHTNQVKLKSDFEDCMLDSFRRLNASEELRREIAKRIS